MCEREAAVEARRRLDRERLAAVFQRALDMFEVAGNVVLRDASELRKVASRDWPIEECTMQCFSHRVVPRRSFG